MARIRPAVVRRRHSATVGLLYFQTGTHVVLLNNVAERANLGPLRARRDTHLEPEANIIIIPKELDMTVALLEARSGQRRRRA